MKKLHVKLKLRTRPFLFIRDTKNVYEQPDGVYDVYELYKRVFPSIYKWTGVRTINKRGNPVNRDRLREIIHEYKEKGYV